MGVTKTIRLLCRDCYIVENAPVRTTFKLIMSGTYYVCQRCSKWDKIVVAKKPKSIFDDAAEMIRNITNIMEENK